MFYLRSPPCQTPRRRRFSSAYLSFLKGIIETAFMWTTFAGSIKERKYDQAGKKRLWKASRRRAVRAIRAGKHVLLEKPSVSNSTEAEILFSLPELHNGGSLEGG
jgi:hypothetical protein